ncbi:prepilin-type N-terminal cleavage/methylation domain-containing protein [Deinococcus metalli]|uniref:Prepilin-type N-terminal cleavage/methylation domain-containing protein n=1 Tax=Deinococcus metalli TaxID=1141878 RepID=A0A7W8KAL1_9DEIO|nr:type II secretion system protein [Deinococcus metalli]MBB5374740.1 prepilin-type N-terminal cleavage/methylation domain-containing protein [Deinococcus metalli]GHF34052.1 hypothetical protein GCM10017781_08590 [Deinococcus metalli]
MNGRLTAGLTLVEVLVSIAIFTVLSVAVLGSLPGILKVNGQTRDEQGVTVPAKAYLEQVRAAFNDPMTTVDPTTGKSTSTGQTNFDNKTVPAPPSGTQMNGYSCANAFTDQVITPAETGSVVTVRRLTLSCTQTGKPIRTFVVDYARPL